MIQSILEDNTVYGSLRASIPIRVIQTDLLQRPDLTPGAKDVFAFLWRAKHQRRRPLARLFFSIGYIAKELGLSTRTVQRAIRLLNTQGLITIIARTRRDNASPTSHEYRVHWRAYQKPDPAPAVVPSPVTTAPDEPGPTVPADAAFAYRDLSPGEVTACQEGGAPESSAGQEIAPPLPEPIVNQESVATMIITPALESAPLYTFDSADALRLFLSRHLKDRGVPVKRFIAWEHTYGLLRVATVALWLLSAPRSSIRSAGGWMDSALSAHWDAPSWVRHAWKKRQHQHALQKRRLAATEAQEAEQQKRAQEEAARTQKMTQTEAEWRSLTNRWAEIPAEVLHYAKTLAQDALGPAFQTLFCKDKPIWRYYHLEAARELWPEGLRSDKG